MLILYGYEKIDFDSFFPRPRLYYDDPGGCILLWEDVLKSYKIQP